MKQQFLMGLLLISFSIAAQIQRSSLNDAVNTPSDYKSGGCYVKVLDSDKAVHLKAILCEWMEWETLKMLRDELEPEISNYDEHYLNKKFKTILRENVPIELKSYYSSKANDTTDACLALARAREVGEYLIEKGLDRSRLKITVAPVMQIDSIWMKYRVIHAVSK